MGNQNTSNSKTRRPKMEKINLSAEINLSTNFEDSIEKRL